jgi:hypothetical protein
LGLDRRPCAAPSHVINALHRCIILLVMSVIVLAVVAAAVWSIVIGLIIVGIAAAGTPVLAGNTVIRLP